MENLTIGIVAIVSCVISFIAGYVLAKGVYNKIYKPNTKLPSSKYDEGERIKSLFMIYFDGAYGVEPVENTSNTFDMGVCKLDYKDNTLTVHLRRPGLLIGRGGKTIDALAEYLDCKIDIIEVIL